MRDKPTVFISYSHKDEYWKDLLKPHLKMLEQVDHIAVWDDRQIDAGSEWYEEIKQALGKASIAVCLITADFLSSDFCVKEEVPALLERREKEGMVLIPLLIRPCAWKAIPWINSIQMLPRDGKSVSKDFKNDYDTVFSEVAMDIFDLVNSQGDQPPHYFTQSEIISAKYVSIDRLPVTGLELFGRKREMEILEDAWNSNKFNVVCFVAWGGVGKTTLINKWIESIKPSNFRGAERVFGWTFYSQGTSKKADSADLFISEALRWFGDSNPLEGSPWNKGRRLAELVCKFKTLLILDGLEPLQSNYDIEKGKIKDPALSVLIQELGKKNPGLLLITTREYIPELNEFTDAVLQQNLDDFSSEAGRSLLRIAGVRGTDKELEDASLAFNNNALAVRLLGSYLYGEEGHSVAHISKIPKSENIPVAKGRHPRRVMSAFENRFGEGAEVNYLRMLGLFDRPAEEEAIKAILRKKTISNLTKNIRKLGGDGQRKLLSNLRNLNLIAQQRKHEKDKVDTHPMVREHFGEQLKAKFPNTWREANGRLYEFYMTKASNLISTVEEMQPLFFAVNHGCAAGRYQEAFHEIYLKRIRRMHESFIIKQLGAFGSDLACISNFFVKLWDEPAMELGERDRLIILRFASLGLRALGRFSDAIYTMNIALNASMSLKDYKTASMSAKDLSEYNLTIGNVKRAIESARQGIALIDDEFPYLYKPWIIATLANAMHQNGKLEEAADLFSEAEEYQRLWDDGSQFLYSVRGFRYCDLLLDQGQYNEVIERAKATLEVAIDNQWVLEIALDQLSLARANLLIAQKQCGDNFLNYEELFDMAVDGLRKSGYQDELARGLLSRATLYRFKRDFEKACHDINEAMTISSRNEMKLYETDCHLEYAKLYIEKGDRLKASKHCKKAKAMVTELGYHRRDNEIKTLENQLD